MMPFYGWPMMGYYGLGFGFLGFLSWFIPIFFPIFLFAWIFGRGRRRRYWEEDHDRAMEILKERYAKGEITKEEFERMKKDLS